MAAADRGCPGTGAAAGRLDGWAVAGGNGWPLASRCDPARAGSDAGAGARTSAAEHRALLSEDVAVPPGPSSGSGSGVDARTRRHAAGPACSGVDRSAAGSAGCDTARSGLCAGACAGSTGDSGRLWTRVTSERGVAAAADAETRSPAAPA
ncbi:hypothetical protein [Mycobacterium kiyosense]|nr:hypothetical protein IWGMT90018_06460 [Mycobacterium kiyosense]